MDDASKQVMTDEVSALRAEYEDESRVFGTMKKLLLVCGIITAVPVFLLFLLKLDTFPQEAGLYGFLLAVPIIVLAPLFIGFLVGCMPAGYIWLWRAAKRSKWFVWGSPLVLLVLLTLAVLVPAGFGFLFFLAQWVKVSNLKHRLCDIENL